MKQIHLTNEGIVLQTKSAGLIKKAEGQFIPFVDGFESSQMTIDIRLKRISFPMNQIDFIRISKGEITLLNRRMAVLKKIAV